MTDQQSMKSSIHRGFVGARSLSSKTYPESTGRIARRDTQHTLTREGGTQHGDYRLDAFRLLSSPEYRLRDWSFLTASPKAFFWPTITSNRFARVIPV